MAWRSSLQLITAVLVLVPIGRAEQATVSLRSGLPESGWFKVIHGYIVEFNRIQKISGRDSIEAFDREGRRVLGVDVLGQLPQAVDVSFDDVSLLPGGPLVAAATVQKIDGGTQSMLLYFNWAGLLSRSVNLPPERDINKLELDEDGNVWTLTDYYGRREDETTGPLIFVYDRSGRLTKGFLNRTDYPAGFKENPGGGGVVAFGVTDEAVWFWQPVRHRMTLVSREGKLLKRMSIALPKSRLDTAKQHPPQANMIALLPSGRTVVGIVCPWPDVPMGAYLSDGKRFFRGSSSTHWLIGVDGSDFLFLQQGPPGSGLFEIVREPLPAGRGRHVRSPRTTAQAEKQRILN